jgi:transposase
MAKCKLAFIAFDSAKDKHAVAVAEDGRDGEVRYFGEIENSADAVNKFVTKLSRRYDRLHFCYEAGPTGYGLHRQLTGLGHVCDVVAPTMIPKRSGDRVKTNRRDAVMLAKLLRAGELSPIWVPDTVHEAVRDLTRARETAMLDLRQKRQQLLSFLLRHGRDYPAQKNWTKMHARWLAAQKFAHPAQQIVFQDQIEAINAAQIRLGDLEQKLREILPTWTMAPVVAAYQALRGVSLLIATIFVAEVGDVRRFATPQQLMAFLGLVPSERTTGDTVRRGSITKTGNRRARRALIEGAWTYRHPARVSERLQKRIEGLPAAVRTIAWKAQVRLCARYRRLTSNGKNTAVAATAVARELAAFMWAIGHQVEQEKRSLGAACVVTSDGPACHTGSAGRQGPPAAGSSRRQRPAGPSTFGAAQAR